MRQVLVTGGTSGIGRAIAKAFAAEGCRVIAAGLGPDEFESAVSLGIECRSLDVTQPGQVAALVSDLERLDVLVNAAGILLRSGQEFEPVSFARVLDVNLTGTLRMCQAARPLLAASQGCIINLASMLSFFGSGYVPAYSASKGGVAQLTKSLAIAWAADGIRVNAIAPGWIETAMTAPLVADPARRDEVVSRTPLKRWGQPADAAEAFVTGVILPVDGGYSIA